MLGKKKGVPTAKKSREILRKPRFPWMTVGAAVPPWVTPPYGGQISAGPVVGLSFAGILIRVRNGSGADARGGLNGFLTPQPPKKWEGVTLVRAEVSG